MTTKIDITKIKPGDSVRISREWYEVTKTHPSHRGVTIRVPETGDHHFLPKVCITGHKPAQPEVQEWFTQELRDWIEQRGERYLGSQIDFAEAALREFYGPPPVPRQYKEGDVVMGHVLVWSTEWLLWYDGYGPELIPGDWYLPQPKAPEGVE